MKFEDFALVLRQRRPWEALDLGQMIARRWRAPVMRAWAASYLPFGLACCTLSYFHPLAGALLLWWSKPVYDRMLLDIYSRAVFGAAPSLRKSLGQLLRSLLRPAVWADLTIRRLSPARSFNMPVSVLEGQAGGKRSARLQILGRSAGGCAAWLTWCASSFFVVIYLTLLVAISLMTPLGVNGFSFVNNPNSGTDLAPYVEVLEMLVIMVCDTLIEPWYVASGFSLYLNRRSELEGWDLELIFRRMSARLAALAARAAQLAAVILLAIALGTASEPVNAQTAGPASVLAGTARQARADAALTPVNVASPQVESIGAADKAAHRVVAGPDFGKNEIRWRWMSRAQPEPTAPLKMPGWLAWLEPLSRLIAYMGVWFIRLLMVIALALAIWLLLRSGLLDRLRVSAFSRKEIQSEVLGMDVRTESLPADVADAARELARRGEITAALALLYRAALSALVHRAEVEFRRGDTEERCLMRARGRINSAAYGYFENLVQLWQLSAYGHRATSLENIEGLCQDWAQRFGPEAALGVGSP